MHSPKQPARYLFLATFLVALFLLPLLIRRGGESGHFIPPGTRSSMPALAVTQLNGHVWRLSEHQGQIVLLNFWVTWCGPCREELPALAQLARNSPPNTLAILGVSLDTADPRAVLAFVDRYHLPYPIALIDPAWQLDQAILEIPTTILIDRSGHVAKTYTGAVDRADLQADLKQLASESPVAASPESPASKSSR